MQVTLDQQLHAAPLHPARQQATDTSLPAGRQSRSPPARKRKAGGHPLEQTRTARIQNCSATKNANGCATIPAQYPTANHECPDWMLVTWVFRGQEIFHLL